MFQSAKEERVCGTSKSVYGFGLAVTPSCYIFGFCNLSGASNVRRSRSVWWKYCGFGEDLPHQQQWLPTGGGGLGRARALVAHGATARAGDRAGWARSIAYCGGRCGVLPCPHREPFGRALSCLVVGPRMWWGRRSRHGSRGRLGWVRQHTRERRGWGTTASWWRSSQDESGVSSATEQRWRCFVSLMLLGIGVQPTPLTPFAWPLVSGRRGQNQRLVIGPN